MEIKDIQRELFYTTVIAERDQMILQLAQEAQKLREALLTLGGPPQTPKEGG